MAKNLFDRKANSTFYVYIHRKKTNNEPFYIGKGSGRRAFDLSESSGRNRHWINTVKKHGVNVEIVQENMTEDDSLRMVLLMSI